MLLDQLLNRIYLLEIIFVPVKLHGELERGWSDEKVTQGCQSTCSISM